MGFMLMAALLTLSVIQGAGDVRSQAGAPSNGTGAVQTLTMGTATGGTFTLGYGGFNTAALAYNCAAADIQAALIALPNVGAAGVAVTGTGPFVITFGGNLAALLVPVITVNGALLTGGTAPAIANTTPGVTASHRGAQKGALVEDTVGGELWQNTGTPQAPAWTKVGTET